MFFVKHRTSLSSYVQEVDIIMEIVRQVRLLRAYLRYFENIYTNRLPYSIFIAMS